MELYENKLKEWHAAGIVDNQTLQAILAYEQKQPKKRKIPLLLTIGLIFFALAVFSFIAANWSVIPDLAKVALMLVLMWGFYTIAYFSETKHFSRPIIYRILGLVMFGASIIVTAQTFHLSSNDATVPWLLFLSAIAHYFIWRHNAFNVFALIFGLATLVSSIETIGWVSWSLFVVVSLAWFYFSDRIEPKVASWLLLLGSGLMLWRLLEFKSPLWPIWTIFVLVVLLFLAPKFEKALRPLYLVFGALSLVVYLAMRGETELSLVDLNGFESILLAVIGAGVGYITWSKFRSITWISILGLVGLLLFDQTAIGLAIVAEASALGYLSVAQRQEKSLTPGFIYFIAVQFVIYVIYAWERLDMSLFFLLGAILLFVLSGIAWWMNRKKEGGAS